MSEVIRSAPLTTSLSVRGPRSMDKENSLTSAALAWVSRPEKPSLSLRLRSLKSVRKKSQRCKSSRTSQKHMTNRFTSKKNRKCCSRCQDLESRTPSLASQLTSKQLSSNLKRLRANLALNMSRRSASAVPLLKRQEATSVSKQTCAITSSRKSTKSRMHLTA